MAVMLDDIKTAKKKAVAEAQARIDDGVIKKETAKTQAEDEAMTAALDDLMEKRTAIFVQDYKAGLDSEAMKDALDAIVAATKEMNDVAKIMTTVTDFIKNLASFLGAGAKVISALKGK